VDVSHDQSFAMNVHSVSIAVGVHVKVVHAPTIIIRSNVIIVDFVKSVMNVNVWSVVMSCTVILSVEVVGNTVNVEIKKPPTILIYFLHLFKCKKEFF